MRPAVETFNSTSLQVTITKAHGLQSVGFLHAHLLRPDEPAFATLTLGSK